MIKKGDKYKDKYDVLFANEYFFVINNCMPLPGLEYNIITQGTLRVKWRYDDILITKSAFDALTQEMNEKLEKILLVD